MDYHLSSYQFTPYSWALIVATLVGLGVALAAWRRRTALGAVYLVLLELAVAEWAFAIAFEAAATELSLKLFWSKIAYLGTTSAPLFYFLFAMAYSQQGKYLTRRNLALLSIAPVLTIVVAATNDWHHWLWTDISINPDTNIAIYGHGLWFWIFVAYSYALLSVGVASLYLAVFRFPAFYKSQVGALLIGSALPIVGNVIYVFGLNPIPGLDWTPVAFVLSGLILVVGVFRFRLLDLIPVARNVLVDTMGDGVLVIDAQGRIADFNPAMQTIIGLPADQVIGHPAAQIFAHWQELIDCFQIDTESQIETYYGKETERCYDLRLSPLRDRRGQLTGQLIVLRDITKHKRLEKERTHLIQELEDALAQVKTLSGLLPICAHCKRIKDDADNWHSVEVYVRDHSEAEFTHSICPDCMRELYPEFVKDKE
jgi:PAS domain S-box-containing protein